jgi:peptide deformylase
MLQDGATRTLLVASVVLYPSLQFVDADQLAWLPDKRLQTKAAKVEAVDDNIQKMIKNMFETMYASDGIGLAATQVDKA